MTALTLKARAGRLAALQILTREEQNIFAAPARSRVPQFISRRGAGL